MTSRITELAAIFGASVLLAACGGGNDASTKEKEMEDYAAQHGVDADVELDDKGEVKSVTVNNGLGGAKVGSNLSLPDGFPGDVPVNADWSIMSTSPVPNGFMLHATTSENAEDALASIRKAMTAQGWTEETSDQPNAMMSRIGFSKGDRMTTFNLMKVNPNLTVQLVTMQKP
ncbi:hypothetical protein [Hyphococcus sp.]|uniref:hypothetical protein n=1 Tax=Hyphococcus sp. TaxID=2038636 RepID=UPI00207E3C24|nr:MAG: hypothetical protein DHS20C04_09720 [Marinicaulis sp.]